MPITELDNKRFTCGDCHYLARAIHKRTGWQIGAFSWPVVENSDRYTWNPGGPDYHAFAIMPDGRVLDVEGVKTQEELKERWRVEAGIIKPFEWKDVKVFGTPDYGRFTYRRAYQVADMLLEAL